MPTPSSTIPGTSVTDRECLEAWRRDPGSDSFRPLIERYGALVYSSAYRRTGSAGNGGEVTRAVFLVLARPARKLRKNTVLAGWLFHVTAVACRKLVRKSRLTGWLHWLGRRVERELPPEVTTWARVAPEIDAAIERLPAAKRNAMLLRVLL